LARRVVSAVCLAGAVIGLAGACGDFLEAEGDGPREAGADGTGSANDGAGGDGNADADEALDSSADVALDVASDVDLDASDTKLDAKVDAAKPPLTCQQTDHYCADFETTATSFAVGTDDLCTGCTIDVVSGVAHRGTKSLKIHMPAGNSPRASRNVPTPALPFFVRAYVYVPTKPPKTLRIMTATTTGGNGFELGVSSNGDLSGISYSNPTQDFSTTSPVTGAGFRCIEWAVTNTGARTYLDDVEVSIAVTRNSTDAFQTFGLGTFWYLTASAPATDVWYDDLVISPTKVGCAR
jgi:hypothetical protein